MNWVTSHARRIARQRWLNSTLLFGVCLGGLLIAIAIAGIVGLVVNDTAQGVTEHALEHDVELEDEGDDLRGAILDLRHYHRDFYFVGPESRQALSNLTGAFLELEEQIRDYAAIDRDPDDNIVSAEELQELADTYWETFRPAVDLYDTDRAAFDRASASGLAMLQEMERAAQAVDTLGEERAERSLGAIERENRKARIILLALLGGLVLVGVGLAWAAIRVVSHIRKLYEHQQVVSSRLGEALESNLNFVADASHELRTPLTVLRGNAEAGLAMDRDCVHAEMLEEIVDESVRMTRLIDDLLLLARSDAASIPLQLREVEALDWLRGVADRASMLAREHGHELTTSLSGAGRLEIDVERVGQAVMILVDNAAKYSRPSGSISLQSSTWKQELTIEVADSGAGIPADDLPRIFDRFYRVNGQQDREGGGTGLGLPIARSIIEAHGGRIDAHSVYGEGTRMRIQLPLAAGRGLPGADMPSRTMGEIADQPGSRSLT